MGVSLHYKGKIKSTEMIPEMVAEVEDICKTNNWSYEVFEKESFRPLAKREEILDAFLSEDADDELKKPDLGLRGITFRPHEESENISLLFDKEGILKSVLVMLFPEIQGHLKMPWSFTKTQFAGVEAHIKTVKLLVYLKNKYFKNFSIRDDGGYYPDGDSETLQKRMGFIDNAIETLNDIFENANFEGNPDEVMGKIQDAISQSFKDISIKIIRLDPNQIPDILNEDGTISDEKPKKKKKKKGDDEGGEGNNDDFSLPWRPDDINI
jgi:hypothetical protein